MPQKKHPKDPRQLLDSARRMSQQATRMSHFWNIEWWSLYHKDSPNYCLQSEILNMCWQYSTPGQITLFGVIPTITEILSYLFAMVLTCILTFFLAHFSGISFWQGWTRKDNSDETWNLMKSRQVRTEIWSSQFYVAYFLVFFWHICLAYFPTFFPAFSPAYLLTFFLTFYLAYFVTFCDHFSVVKSGISFNILSGILTGICSRSFLAFCLAYLLAFYLAHLRTVFLAFYQAFFSSIFSRMLSGISPESFSDIKAGMSSDIFSGMQNPAYLLAVFCRSIWYTLWSFNIAMENCP